MQFAIEKYSAAIHEAEALIRRHYEEIAWKRDKIPLDVNHAQYLMVESKGGLRIHTARVDGELVGYAAWFIVNHMHYKTTKIANNDVLYIAPEHRGGIGGPFISFCEGDLRAQGAQVSTLHIKTVLNWGRLAENLGYEHTDSTWCKWLGD
jgi:hypothetical protein